MKNKEIAQALRCCAKGLGHDDACENCKVGEIQDRREYIEFAAANVIERLTAENAALRENIHSENILKVFIRIFKYPISFSIFTIQRT